MTEATEKDVAEWLLAKVIAEEAVYQEIAVAEIADKFGDKFVYINENGNLAIGKNVLKAFRRLSATNVVWERGARYWRLRQEYDVPGRQQD